MRMPNLDELGETAIYLSILVLSGGAAVGRALRDQRRSTNTARLVVSSFLFGSLFGVMTVALTFRERVTTSAMYAVGVGIGAGFVSGLVSAEVILQAIAKLSVPILLPMLNALGSIQKKQQEEEERRAAKKDRDARSQNARNESPKSDDTSKRLPD